MTQLVGYKGLFRDYGIGFTRQHILRLQTKYTPPRFPIRRKVGNVNFWTRDEIEEWIANLEKPNPPGTPALKSG